MTAGCELTDSKKNSCKNCLQLNLDCVWCDSTNQCFNGTDSTDECLNNRIHDLTQCSLQYQFPMSVIYGVSASFVVLCGLYIYIKCRRKRKKPELLIQKPTNWTPKVNRSASINNSGNEGIEYEGGVINVSGGSTGGLPAPVLYPPPPNTTSNTTQQHTQSIDSNSPQYTIVSTNNSNTIPITNSYQNLNTQPHYPLPKMGKLGSSKSMPINPIITNDNENNKNQNNNNDNNNDNINNDLININNNNNNKTNITNQQSPIHTSLPYSHTQHISQFQMQTPNVNPINTPSNTRKSK